METTNKIQYDTDYIDLLYNYYKICRQILICYSLYDEYCRKPDYEQREIDILIRNSLLDFCIVNWCKLFADKNKDQFVIERLLSNYQVKYEQFHAALLTELKMSQEEYDLMWNNLKLWRDKVIAHLDYSKIVDEEIPTKYFAYIPKSAFIASLQIAKVFQEEYIAHPDTTFVLGKETLDFNRLALAIQENASSLSATLNKCLE